MNFNVKSLELAKIENLANSIDCSGLLNPITVYKHLDKYRIIAGECRFLACNMLGKTEMECRIYQNKINTFDLKLMQWHENTQRNDLSLYERLENIRSVLLNYIKVKEEGSIRPKHLQEVFKFSKAQASAYASVLNCNEQILNCIKQGEINNLDKAAFLTSLDNPIQIELALKLNALGYGLNKIKDAINKGDYFKNSENKSNIVKTLSNSEQKLSLGKVKNHTVLQTIMDAVIAHPNYKHLRDELNNYSEGTPSEVLKDFKKLISALEK